MSVEATIKNLAKDLHNIGLSPTGPSTTSSGTKSAKQNHVADSWEDDASDTEDTNTTKPPSSSSADHSTSIPLIAPGPTHLKSPESRALDAEHEIDHALNLNATDVPPPTPISPSLHNSNPIFPLSSSTSRPQSSTTASSSIRSPPLPSTSFRTTTPQSHYDSNSGEKRRPEKTTATANRLIAGALGIRAPARTEEQSKYDRVVKEAEIKKRNKEREERERSKEEDERERNAVWDN